MSEEMTDTIEVRLFKSALSVHLSREKMTKLPAQEQLTLIREYGQATGYGDAIVVSDRQLRGVGLAIAEMDLKIAMLNRELVRAHVKLVEQAREEDER